MRFGSVCSGIEAASVAWEPLGWKAAWFSEIEPFPCAVLKHHYPDVPNLGDMTTLPGRILSGEVEAPDVFCGGTPCQAFSVAGNRKSLDDARGNLSLTFCEIADATDTIRQQRNELPVIIFWENVPGVLNTKDNAFGCFLAKLAGETVPLQPSGGRWTDAGVVLGPKRAIAWRVCDAQYFGLAQRRRRVFVVASARKGFNPAEILFEFDSLRRDSAPSREARKGIAADAQSGFELHETVETLCADTHPGSYSRQDAYTGRLIPVECYNIIADVTPKVTNEIAGTLRADGGGGIVPSSVAYTYGIPGNWIGRAPENGGNAVEPMNNIAPCLTGADRHGVAAPYPPHAFKIRGGCEGGGKGYLGQDEQAFTLLAGDTQALAVPITCATKQQAMTVENDMASTLASHDYKEPQAVALAYDMKQHHNPQPTETFSLTTENCSNVRGDTPLVQVQYAVRRLTPIECERLQGFPDNYTNIPWRNKPEAPDGPRYKALGNSWAVPVVRWIGKRIHNAVN